MCSPHHQLTEWCSCGPISCPLPKQRSCVRQFMIAASVFGKEKLFPHHLKAVSYALPVRFHGILGSDHRVLRGSAPSAEYHGGAQRMMEMICSNCGRMHARGAALGVRPGSSATRAAPAYADGTDALLNLSLLRATCILGVPCIHCCWHCMRSSTSKREERTDKG
jgi:hypothetical protein